MVKILRITEEEHQRYQSGQATCDDCFWESFPDNSAPTPKAVAYYDVEDLGSIPLCSKHMELLDYDGIEYNEFLVGSAEIE
jgi:hypothetical protein